MFLRFLVVIDAYEEKIVCIFKYFALILLAMNLLNSSVCILVIFQFDNHCRFVAEFAWEEYKVSKALATGKFTMYYVIVLCVDVCNGEYTRKRVLIVV